MTQSFNSLIEELRDMAQELLREEQVDIFIGFGPGTLAARTTPLFISEPGAAAELTWSPFCTNNLAGYLLDYRESSEKIGVLVKSCDSRSIIRLLQDKQFPRERLVVAGISCTGLLDTEKVALELDPLARVTEVQEDGNSFVVTTDAGEHRFAKQDYLLPKCLECMDSTPVIYDRFVGRVAASPESGKDKICQNKEIESMEKWSPREKSEFWDRYFRNCLRCYACRNVCPACNCRECIFDQAGPDWVSKRNNLGENTAFHVIRALHVAGRCVDCGECDRVCPVNIPLRHLNHKVLKDIEELFDAPMPGTDIEQQPVLGHYCAGDPDEFK